MLVHSLTPWEENSHSPAPSFAPSIQSSRMTLPCDSGHAHHNYLFLQVTDKYHFPSLNYQLRPSNSMTTELATLTQGMPKYIIIMKNVTHTFNTLCNSTKDPEIPDPFSWLRLYNRKLCHQPDYKEFLHFNLFSSILFSQ